MKKALEKVGIFFLFVIFFVFLGGFYAGARYADNKIGVDSLQHKVDSLHDENFVLGVELNRWETTIEWYREENPSEAKKLDDWKSQNTE
jgi:hypothetical protein